MKKDIHPQIKEITAHCTCGATFKMRSTAEEIKTTLCSKCHPFYTGEQKFVDTMGRIERFEQKYNKGKKVAKKK